MNLSSGTLLGHRYRIETLVGSGGMGEVYLAHDEQLDRTVALKVLPSDVAANKQRMHRFVQEAKAVSALNHPNILTIHEIGQSDGTHFIATEFIDGQTLRQRMKSELPITEAIDISMQVASALDAAHSAGIIHRDIKPENVMLRRDGYAKVLDFGLVKLMALSSANAGEAATLINTEPGMVMGTTNYMSPEQARGLDVDARTDIWSLGILLYEMVAARPPFSGATSTDVLVAILDKLTPPLPTSVPATLNRIIQKALEKDTKLRYQTAGELLHDLKQFRRELELDVSAAPTQVLTKPRGKTAGRRMLIALVTLIVLSMAVSIYLLRNRSTGSPNNLNGDRITLAVLPFRPLNAADEIGFLGIGIPDAIITRLANIQQLRLRPTNAILRYQNRDVNAQQAGQELGSEYLVTGTLQKVGDSLRVSVQLVRANDGSTLWGDHYDNARSDLLSVQDSIAEQIATKLRIRMSDNEQRQVYRRYTENGAAYEMYLRGRSQLAHSTQETTLAAIQAFEGALKLDPSYTLARSGLSMACAEMHLYFAAAPEVQMWGERAKQEAQRALAEDANLGETHLALAAVYGKTEFDWARTISESQQALQLNPTLDLPHYLRGRAFYHLGLFEQADKDVREGLDINPSIDSENQFEALRTKGNTALLSGRYSEAVAALEEAHRRSAGSVSDWWLAQAYYYQGQKERAEKMLEELQHSSSASAAARAKAILSSFLAARGERLRAQQLIITIEAETYMDHHVAYSIGLAYAQMQDHDRAMLWLRKAAETGFPCYPWFERDPLLDPLRKDSNFERFMTELKNNYETAKARYAA